MKKRLFLILILFFSFLKPTNIYAASGSITISTPKNSIVVGEKIVATVTLSSSASLGAWKFSLDYDSSLLKLTSTNNDRRIVDTASNTTTKKISYTYTFTALKTGQAKLLIKDAEVLDYESEQKMSLAINNKEVSIVTKTVVEKKYSANNFLSSLSIDGYDLEPVFNKNTLTYDLELENDIENIIVKATSEDKSARVLGIGEISVNEGLNKIEVKVIAENGNSKIYTLNVRVKEEIPVNVLIDGKNYVVVQKINDIDIPMGYLVDEMEINDNLVPVFKNEITKLTLIVLKNEEGENNLYIVDSKNNNYELYQEISFNKLILFLKEPNEKVIIPSNYKQTKIKINEIEVLAYKFNSKSKYSLIYGMNTETGEENLYMYDSKEETIQRYNDEEIKELTNQINDYFKVIMILGPLGLIFFITIIILIIKNRKLKKVSKVINKNII